jgi:phage terminase large subunit GpA-like protein
MIADESDVAEIRAAFRPRPCRALTLDRWADAFRHLASSVAAVPGPFRTSRVEVARGPLRAVTEPGVRTITIKSATQLMKTTALETVLGYLIHQRPCPILAVFPKTDAVKSFSKERFSALVRATPVLRDILGDVAHDRSGESLAFKEFPGGFLALESAGSATNLAARPIKVTLLDEIDKFADLQEEGDPVLLAEERTATFPDALHLRCCSPTWKETSRIERSYNESDQRRPFVACPHCGHEQTLDFFRHVQWAKSDDGREHFPLTAAIYCESCGAEWSELQRLERLTTEGGVRWNQTRPFVCCGIHQEPLESRKWQWSEEHAVGYALCTECGKRGIGNQHAGFTASKLYAPQITVASLAEKWIAAKDDLAARQVFYNTQLGLAFTAQATKRVETHELASRREKFGAVLPREVLRLTCGVDAQGDRLEAHVVGWGHPEEAWSVHYQVFPGDLSRPEIWQQLDEFLQLGFPHAIGARMIISGTCIDSGGGHTEMTYRFCQPRAARNIWAIKGSSWARRGEPVWPIPKVRKTRDWGYKPVVIAVDSAKDHLRQMLLNEEPGPGYFHIPAERSNAWLDQLTAEQAIFEKKAGATIRKWHLPRGRANEAFDTLVYAYAALCGLKAVRGLNMERAAAEFERQALTHGVAS